MYNSIANNNSILKFKHEMFHSDVNNQYFSDDWFSTKVVTAITDQLNEICKQHHLQLIISDAEHIKDIYRALNQELKPRIKKLATEKRGINDRITNYTSLQKDIKLNNVYTPYNGKERDSTAIEMADPETQRFITVIANRTLWRERNYTGDQPGDHFSNTTLSMYVTAPLTDGRNLLTTVWEVQIATDSDLITVDNTHYITDEQSKSLRATAQLASYAGLHGIVNVLSGPNTDPQDIITYYRHFAQISQNTSYISADLISLPLTKIRQLHNHSIDQYTDFMQQFCKSATLRPILTGADTAYDIITLDGRQQAKLQQLLASVINASLIKKQLKKIHGQLATSEDVLSFIRKEEQPVPLTKARYLLNSSRREFTPFDAIDQDEQTQANKLLAPIIDNNDIDNFHQSLLLPANHRQYTSPFVSVDSQILLAGNKLITSLWGCITDDQYSWLAPFLIYVEVEHRETKDIIRPFTIKQPELSMYQTKKRQSTTSQQSLQMIRYHLNSLLKSLDDQTQVKPIIVRRKSYYHKLGEFF